MSVLRRFVAVLSVCWGAGFWFILNITFILAYLGGGRVVITINEYNEMVFESVFLAFIGALYLAGTVITLMFLARGLKDE